MNRKKSKTKARSTYKKNNTIREPRTVGRLTGKIINTMNKYVTGPKDPLKFAIANVTFDQMNKLFDLKSELEKHYFNFSKNLYYNDSFYFYKIVFQIYKNNFNSKAHGYFSRIINEYLFRGKIRELTRNDIINFSLLNNSTLPSRHHLESFIQNIIHLLDECLYYLCPPIKFDFISYRYETRDKSDIVSNLVEGDYYHSIGYMSSSLSPYNYYDRFETINKTTTNIVLMILLLPENTRGYYVQNPHIYIDPPNYQYDKNHITAIEEYEYLLPRNTIWKVEDRIQIDDSNIVYIMRLVKQMEPMNIKEALNTSIKMNEEEMNQFIISSQRLIKNNRNNRNNGELGKVDIEKYREDIKFKLQLIGQKKYFDEIEDPLKQKSKALKYYLKIRIPYTFYFDLNKLQTKFADYFSSTSTISLNGQSIMLYLGPNMKNLYKFYSNLLTTRKTWKPNNKNKDQIIRCDIPFYGLRNEEYYSYEFHKFFQYFTYIFKCFDKCEFDKMNISQVVNHMYIVDTKFPIFFVIQLNAKKNIDAYPISNSECLIIGKKYNLKINFLKKIQFHLNYFYCVINADMV
jgi:hypothetical protein